MARDPGAAANGHSGGEDAVLEWLRARIGDGPANARYDACPPDAWDRAGQPDARGHARPPHPGGEVGESPAGGQWAEVWLGDDTAVLPPLPPSVLFATDAVVAGVHADLSLVGVDDLGWRALASNVSDVAAMGGRTVAAVVSVTGPPTTDVGALYAGLLEAARSYDVRLVGGDLTTGHELVVAVAVIGTTDGRAAVLRGGARPGDSLFVTGPLGAAAAGLRLLRAGAARPSGSRSGSAVEDAVRAHRRPLAQAQAGIVAACGGATAMMDVSDGFSGDLARLTRASGVDALVDEVPVAPAATFEEAVGGGDDYQLLIATPRPEDLVADFQRAGLTTPILIGQAVSGSGTVWLQGKPLEPAGWEHPWGAPRRTTAPTRSDGATPD